MQAYDRRIAAIHEAGHAVMAHHLGCNVEAWIHPRKNADAQEEKTWGGHVIMLTPPACYNHRAMIAVAGMVAEHLWKEGCDEEYAEPYVWQDILTDAACMSPADWDYADYEPGESDDDLFDLVAEVARLLMNDLWPSLTRLSRTLSAVGDDHIVLLQAA